MGPSACAQLDVLSRWSCGAISSVSRLCLTSRVVSTRVVYTVSGVLIVSEGKGHLAAVSASWLEEGVLVFLRTPRLSVTCQLCSTAPVMDLQTLLLDCELFAYHIHLLFLFL